MAGRFLQLESLRFDATEHEACFHNSQQHESVLVSGKQTGAGLQRSKESAADVVLQLLDESRNELQK